MFLETLQTLSWVFQYSSVFDLNRNKVKPLKYTTEEGRKILKGADVIIVDGDCIVPKEVHQIVLHIVAALPGDEVIIQIKFLLSKDPAINLETTTPNFYLKISPWEEKFWRLIACTSAFKNYG